MARLIDSIQGHEAVWRKLQDLVARERLPHAMAFTGPPGVGKRLMAWALAQRLVCEREGQQPCGQCSQCLRVAAQQSESVFFVEPQGHLIKIEAAHQILHFLSLQQLGRARIVIVDQAQLLNPQAGNALLKILEEPPANSFFILITPEISQLLPTLRSRTQVLRFAPLSDEVLRQGAEVPEWMLRSARGSFENLEAFRNEAAIELRQMVIQFLTAAFRGERGHLQDIVDASKDKENGHKVICLLQQMLRDWAVVETGQGLLHSDLQAEIASFPNWPPHEKGHLLRHVLQMEADLLGNVDRSLVFENFFYRVRPLSSPASLR